MTPPPIRKLLLSQAVRNSPSMVQSWLAAILCGERSSSIGKPTQGSHGRELRDQQISKNGIDSSVRDSERPL
jgi:hypothetical protein